MRKEGANGQNSDRGEEPPEETSERGTSENRHEESHRYGWSLKSLTSSVARTILKIVCIETLEAFARRALLTSGFGEQLGARDTGSHRLNRTYLRRYINKFMCAILRRSMGCG